MAFFNLYPPIVSTYMPSFIRTQSCKIYFNLSNFNSIADIKNVQVTIVNQNTNYTALNTDKYPTGIKITNLSINESSEGDPYYISISPSDLQSGIFELNQFYKIQLRFTSIEAAELTDDKKIATWLVENQSFFSEWSTVCLIKGIQQPLIDIKGFDSSSSIEETVFTKDFNTVVGKMYFDENANIEKEYMDYYTISISDRSKDNSKVFESKIIYTNKSNPNEINYVFQYLLQENVQYLLTVNYCTNNGYQGSKSFNFLIRKPTVNKINGTLTIENDIENGRFKITMNFIENFIGNLAFRRTSSDSNFTVWEDVHIITLLDSGSASLKYSWYDYTIESGVFYKYGVQKIESNNARSELFENTYPTMQVFDYCFLTRSDLQLKIKYNAQLNNLKTNVLETKTDTIGGEFPYFYRNGSVKYKQFNLSGLITAFCDEDGIFINKDNIYEDSKSLYNEYNIANQITNYNDYIYEREFRKKITDFLYDNTIKLFRSTTEGNILIKLMDISLSPEETLGRMLYTFNATAYEIDNCSLDNYYKYGICNIGSFQSYLDILHKKVGQLEGTYSMPQQNLVKIINEKYKYSIIPGYLGNVTALKWIRLTFNSDPYLINIGANGILSIANTPNKNTVFGYIVYINEEPILVDKKGFYELKDDDTLINSIWFPTSTKVTLDYYCEVLETEEPKSESQIAHYYYYYKVGQLWGQFKSKNDIVRQIYLKYLIDYNAYIQKLTYIDYVKIEAAPGVIIYIKDSSDSYEYRHVIGDTGILELYDEDITIDKLYFQGVHFIEAEDPDRDFARDNEFVKTGITENLIEDIKYPIKNGVYHIASLDKDYIYYNNSWYLFDENHDITCDVDAIVDYYYQLMRGEY